MIESLSLEIVEADCMTVPVAFAVDFHAMITDPPYSPHVHANAVSYGGSKTAHTMGVKKRDLGFESLRGKLRRHIAGFAANVIGWSLIYSDVESSHLWRRSCRVAGAEYIRPVPWIRWSQPQMSGDRPPTGAELVSCFFGTEAADLIQAFYGERADGDRLFWNGPGDLVAFTRRAMRGKEKHPTEKPLDLMLDQVSWFSQPGENVFDPCSGSGTTGLACRLLGRNFFGTELDPEWAKKGSLRLHGTISDRDRVRAEEWCVSVCEEAEEFLARPVATDGSDKKTRERAQRRIDDVHRVVVSLQSQAA